ncbi:MAG: ATP-binding protein [Algiphilus sp.]|uniref:ATP-binding protein n=1 Tax=Algiphilus sp. TaxID=1872431 RepID=UPI002A670987|nr:ATP-binding protein [Pseudomonadota bacterium]
MAFDLSSISSARDPKPPITLIYGGPGLGKTTFFSQTPGAVFLPVEDGLGTLEVNAFPQPSEWAEVMSAMETLYTEEHGFNWFVIDTVSAMEELIYKQVCRDEGVESVEKIPYGKGHVMALSYWQQLLEGLAALRDQRRMGIGLIAHAEIQRFEAPETDSYDRYQISLNKRAFKLFYERCDVIGYAAYQVSVRKQEQGFGKAEVKAKGTGKRLLHLSERPAWIAKNRYGMPDTIPLAWPAFAEALRVGVTGETPDSDTDESAEQQAADQNQGADTSTTESQAA